MKLYNVTTVQQNFPSNLTVNVTREVASSKEEALGYQISRMDKKYGGLVFQQVDEIPLSFLKDVIRTIEVSE